MNEAMKALRAAGLALRVADGVLGRDPLLASVSSVLGYSLAVERISGIQDNTYPSKWKEKAEELARETGGFTIRDDPNDPDDAPSSGYQVAIPGHADDTISTGEGWANWGRDNNHLLHGPDRAMGTWMNDETGKYETEPSETIHDYDSAAREMLKRDQWSMWDNGAYVIDPATGKRRYLDQADIPRTDIAQQGIANSTGFTLSKKKTRMR